MPHALLALDFGTQSVRAVLFDARGHTLARVQHPLRRPDAPRPGWAELDAGYLWRALADACRALWREPGADPRAVAAVGLATQRNTVLCLDDDGRPLRPAILWLDQRRATTLPPLAPHWRAAMALAGQRATVAQLRAQARSNWLHQHEPGLWARTASYVFLSGYLTRRLTGRDADAVGCQVGYVPFDYARQRWAAPHDWRWRALDIAPRQLPELVPVGGTIGTITRAAAVDTGIPAGT
ncbi:MAG TPA: FGGY family carbohydrate kinase, partial [Gemmatimonadaceae bacterium]